MSKFVSSRREEPPRISYNSFRNVRYGECQKNHAAHRGGYVLDGCQEFMANGPEGTEAALTCQACRCNKSFHKREVVASGVYNNGA